VTKKISKRKHQLREKLEQGSSEWVWPQEGEYGYAMVPRTLPIILALLQHKALNDLNGNMNLAATYLDLLARNMGEGLVEFEDESVHAFLAGFNPQRGRRSWRERILQLERLGFIRLKTYGPRKLARAIIVHPHLVVAHLQRQGRVPDEIWHMITETAERNGANMAMLEADRYEQFFGNGSGAETGGTRRRTPPRRRGAKTSAPKGERTSS
jgi:hypothetical protein